MANRPYKRTEKWWLGLTVLFYALYNLPGVPAYGDANAALWHGFLTIVPLWVVVYVGMITINRQRKLRKMPDQREEADSAIDSPASKGVI